jgi:hypothetical protein
MPNQKKFLPSFLVLCRGNKTVKEGHQIWRHNNNHFKPFKNVIPHQMSRITMEKQVFRRFQIMITPNTIIITQRLL